MKDTTKKLLDQVEANHDWESGQTYGGSGTQLSRTDTCRVCGLKRHWFSDSQNGVEDHYTFETINGEKMSLKEAVDPC
jgi:hypothetical protein